MFNCITYLQNFKTMDSAIENYVTLLTNNTFVAKYCKVPDTLDESFNHNTDSLEIDETAEAIEYSYEKFIASIQNKWLQPDFLRAYELNGFRKSGDLIEFLDPKFEEFKEAFAKYKCWNDKSLTKKLTNQLRTSREELHTLSNKIYFLEDAILRGLLKTKHDYCREAYSFVRSFIAFIPDPVEQKTLRARRPIENLTNLTQNQIVILFHYLRDFGFVGKDMPKNMYAEQISGLTGFAVEKIRQALSHIEKESSSIDSVKFTEVDYSVIRRALEKIIAAIKSESDRKFS